MDDQYQLNAFDLDEIAYISDWLGSERLRDDTMANVPADELERFLWVAWG